uniref:Filament-like plant protein 4 n=1 Tax=Anthurium amnicola TaxID=1678845 RepID=A0A1D1XYJ3_9ARAE
MDRRSWPWKKKTSEKTVAATDHTGASLASSVGNQGDQDNSKHVNYVQISKETYTHVTELEDQVKGLNDQVKVLNEKLSTAQADFVTKDNLVKQHAKVAEEAVSGWEKAEAEALALKNQLESVTLLKLTVEERASQLDGALKECMKQIRTVKEDSEQQLHDVVFAKTKQWEKIKFELDSKLSEFEQELLRASAENAALSRSLQERYNMMMKISDEKSRADAEIEILKTNIQSCEREISSLKYEVQVVSKELEIRNEERNMSVRSAEVANKQHLEDVKKITKLEAECQRLRGLVRKKLPGPAALAQMKQEVENLGRDYGETRLWHSPGKSASPRPVPADFALENIQKCHKENEFLTARLLTMEEETKMLKEALSRRNSELQASRNICAKTSSKLRSLEAHMLAMDQRISPSKSNLGIPIGGSLSLNGSNPPSFTSMSEDGIDEEGSCGDSWATALMSELSHFKKDKNTCKSNKVDNSNPLDIMDDFLEMEKLACLSAESNGNLAGTNVTMDKIKNENIMGETVVEVHSDGDLHKEQHPSLDEPRDLASSHEEQSSGDVTSASRVVLLSKLKSRVALAIEAQTKNFDMGVLLEDLKRIVHDTQEKLSQLSVSCVIEESNALLDKHCPEDMGETIDSGISSACDDKSCPDTKASTDQDLKNAVSQILDFVTSVCKEAVEIQSMSSDSQLVGPKVARFYDCVSKVLCNEIGFDTLIVALSSILCEIKEFNFKMLRDQDNERESNSSDCIDKVTLLENKVETGREKFSNHCALVPNSDSYPDNQNGDASPGFELKDTIDKCSTEEFVQLKLEKDGLQVELARCTESLERAKIQLLEMEQKLAELKSQLSASHKSNSLAETQLKCMAESYKSLETRAQDLESKVSLLSARAETLDNELQQERCSHQDDLAKCKYLQEELERYQKCTMFKHASDADIDIKEKQEREIAAAAEKLAECQETILLLGRQLNALRPQTELVDSSSDCRLQTNEDFLENVLGRNGFDERGRHSFQLSDHVDVENTACFLQITEGESPLEGFNPLFSPPHTEAGPIPRSPISSNHSKHRSSRSSSSCSSNTAPEKHGRSFSRFFSKGKSGR